MSDDSGSDGARLEAQLASLRARLQAYSGDHLIADAFGHYLSSNGGRPIPGLQIYDLQELNIDGFLTQTWDKDHVLDKPIVFSTLLKPRCRRAFGGGTWYNRRDETIERFNICTLYYTRDDGDAPQAANQAKFTLLEFSLEPKEPSVNVAICVMNRTDRRGLRTYLYKAACEGTSLMYQANRVAPPLPLPAQQPNIDGDGDEGSSIYVDSNNENFRGYDPTSSVPVSVTGATDPYNAMTTNSPWVQNLEGLQLAIALTSFEVVGTPSVRNKGRCIVIISVSDLSTSCNKSDTLIMDEREYTQACILINRKEEA